MCKEKINPATPERPEMHGAENASKKPLDRWETAVTVQKGVAAAVDGTSDHSLRRDSRV